MVDISNFNNEVNRRNGQVYKVRTKTKSNVNTLEKTYFFDDKPVQMTEPEYNKVRYGQGVNTKVRQSVLDQIYQPGESRTNTPPPSKWGGDVVRREPSNATPNPLQYRPYGEGKPGGEYDRRGPSLPSDSDYYRRDKGKQLPSDADYYRRRPVPSREADSPTPKPESRDAPNRFSPNRPGSQAPPLEPYRPVGTGSGRNPVTGKQNPAYIPDPPRKPNYTSQPPTPYRPTYTRDPSRTTVPRGVGGGLGAGFEDAVAKDNAERAEARRYRKFIEDNQTQEQREKAANDHLERYKNTNPLFGGPKNFTYPPGYTNSWGSPDFDRLVDDANRHRQREGLKPIDGSGVVPVDRDKQDKWKSPFHPGKIDDKFRSFFKDDEFKPGEREKNRKKWDTINPNAPFEPRNPTDPKWGDWPPMDPFGMPPGQPGGAVPQEPLDHLSGFMVYVREDFKASFKVSEYGALQGLTDSSNSSTSITKTFFRIDYDIFQSPSFQVVADSLTGGTMLLSDSTGIYPSFKQTIYFKDGKGLGGGWEFFQFLYDFSSVLLTETQLSQYKTLLGRNHANRFEYGIGSQVISFTNSVVAVVPQFDPGTRPGRPDSSPPKEDPPLPDPSEDKKMNCRYATDNEVPTTIYDYDSLTKTIKPKQEMVHEGFNEFASRMSKQVAELAKAVDKISDALDVPKYSQPAGKPILPQAFIDVVGPALFATGGIAALPAKTLPQEMLIFQALSHYLSGFQMLGKVPMSTDMTNPAAPKIMPKSALGFNIMAHNNTTGLIGVPNDIKRVNDKGVSSNNSNKNATDAIEKTQALAESNAVDLSGIQNMLMSIIKQNEMLTLMVDESTAKVEMLVKDAGFKIDYEKREIPTVVSHMKKDDKGGKKSTPESSFNWDSVMKQGKATRLIPVWSKNNDVDKLQLGLKTNMSAQVAASSVLFPISKKGKAQFPDLKTKQTTDFDKWAFSLMKTEDLRDGGLSSVPKIEVISKGVTKAIIYQGPTIGKA